VPSGVVSHSDATIIGGLPSILRLRVRALVFLVLFNDSQDDASDGDDDDDAEVICSVSLIEQLDPPQ